MHGRKTSKLVYIDNSSTDKQLPTTQWPRNREIFEYLSDLRIFKLSELVIRLQISYFGCIVYEMGSRAEIEMDIVSFDSRVFTCECCS